MSMNYHHQLQLLVDILKNQQDEHYGTHDEYSQIQDLIKDLLENQSVSSETKAALMNLEQFTYEHDQEGQKANFSNEELQQFVNTFEEFTPF